MRLTRITLFFIAFIICLGFYRLLDHLLQGPEGQTLQATEEVMVDSAHLLAGLLENESNLEKTSLVDVFAQANKHQVSATIYGIEKKNIGLQALVTNAEGIVIFDSENPARIGQDLSGARDIHRTLAGKYGARSTRIDEADDSSSVMYVAAPIFAENGDLRGVVSVYKKQSDVLPFIHARRRDIIFTTIFIGVGILALITAVFIWLFRPVGKLTNYARALTRGERQPLPKLGAGLEVNTLGNALRDLHEELAGRQYVEQYVQTLTHELKSPLAAIQGAAELLQEDMPAEQRQRFLQNIRQETQRCEKLTHRLLELAAVENLEHLQDVAELDLVEICRQVLKYCEPTAEMAKVHLKSDLPDSAPFSGNKNLLVSALLNLLENALHFSPTESKVSLILRKEDERYLIMIRDEGSGLPDYALERSFERFYSYREHQKTPHHGHGLGLAFVKEVAELHHGIVTLENNPAPENGATASLILPRA